MSARDKFLNEYTNKEYSEDFSLLDIDFICSKFNLKNAKVTGDRLHITSQRDEWFVDNRRGYLTLHHKNKWAVTKRYHEEDRSFANIFSVLGYIRRHDELIFKNHYSNRRLDRLFEEIARA